MLFRVPGFGGHPDSLTIFVSHPVVPIQQVFHRENQKNLDSLASFSRIIHWIELFFLFSKLFKFTRRVNCDCWNSINLWYTMMKSECNIYLKKRFKFLFSWTLVFEKWYQARNNAKQYIVQSRLCKILFAVIYLLGLNSF